MDKERKKKPENADAENENAVDTEENTDSSAESTAAETEPDKKNNGLAENKASEAASDGGQADENGEGADKPDDTEDNSEAEQAKAENTAQSDLAQKLLTANAQLAAYKEGVRKDCVEDAVCLAMFGAKKKGEVTEETIAEALNDVLNRHPEWKGCEETKESFRIGADGMQKANSSTDEISQIFGNK